MSRGNEFCPPENAGKRKKITDMIALDLQCNNGHRFEGWFDDSQAFEEQKEKGLIGCPVCSSTDIARIPSVFAIKSAHPESKDYLDQKKQSEIITRSIAMYIDKNFENVGCDFAKEALKMHYGVSEKKNIRGTSSDEDEKMLREEGVEIYKIPLPDTES